MKSEPLHTEEKSQQVVNHPSLFNPISTSKKPDFHSEGPMLEGSAAAQSISAQPELASHGSETAWSIHMFTEARWKMEVDSKINNGILAEHCATSLRHYAQCYLVPRAAMTPIFPFVWKFVQWTLSTFNRIQVPL